MICQPTIIGVRTAGRIMEIVRSLKLGIGACYLVLNPCPGPVPADLLAQFQQTGLELLATIPADAAVAEFSVRGQAVMELPADAPAVVAVDGLVAKVLERSKL